MSMTIDDLSHDSPSEIGSPISKEKTKIILYNTTFFWLLFSFHIPILSPGRLAFQAPVHVILSLVESRSCLPTAHCRLVACGQYFYLFPLDSLQLPVFPHK